MIEQEPPKGIALYIASAAVCLGVLLITLDQFIANVSIPTISGDLGVSQDHGAWVITSYTVASAISIPLTGWLTKLCGRVKLFAFAAILFSLMSLSCGLSRSLGMLLFFRFLQGLVSGPLIPLSQAFLMSLFPNKKGAALGWWGLVVMVGPAMGPVLGGWITYNFSWSWIFFINVPLGILSGVITLALLSHFDSEKKKLPIDVIGLVFLVLWVGALQLMLDRGNDLDWFQSYFIRGLAITAVVTFCFFIIWESFHKDPVVDLSFFRSRNFTLGNLVIGVSFALIFGNLVVGPLWVQAQLGYTPLWAGLSLAPLGCTAVIAFPLVGKYQDKVDLRLLVGLSLLLLAISFFWISRLPVYPPFVAVAMPRVIQGLSFALLFVPLTTIALSGVAPEKTPDAAGLFAFTRMLFVGIGVSLSVSHWLRRENFFQNRFTSYVIPSNPQFAPYMATLEKLGIEGRKADAVVYEMVQNQAFTVTFLEICYITGLAFVVLLFLLLFFRSRKAAQARAEKLAK